MHDMPEAVAGVLLDIDRNFEDRIKNAVIDNYSTLAPVGYAGFRWATQIDPTWNAYLLALVLSLAEEIEQARIPEDHERVFSYRYRPLPSDGLFSQESWKQFQEKTRSLADMSGFVVAADISDFYSRIYHHRLENSLRDLDKPGGITKQIMKILGKLSNNTSYGLPVGGPAARILSELVLNRVDRLLLTDPATRNFCRFADDYRFFVPDMESAYSAIGFLSEKLLRNEGLSLQKTKTRIMTSAEYMSTLDPSEAVRGSAARFLGLHLHYDPYSATADEDYEHLKNKIEEFDILALLRAEMEKGRIHTALTRRLVSSLSYLDPVPRRQAALSLLENLETLVPVTSQVMHSLRGTMDHIDDTEFSEQVSSRLREMIFDSHFIAKIDLNLAYMVRVLSGHKSMENEQLLISLFDATHGFSSGPAPIIQRDIVLTLARWRTTYWLSDLKNYIASMHPWVRRAFIVASYTLGDEGHHWRQANRPATGSLDLVVRDWSASKFQDINWEVPA